MKTTPFHVAPPVSRDRIISHFPKCYTPEAALQLKDHFGPQVRNTCQQRSPGSVGLKVSKVVMVGDLCVGKTSLINRFCKDAFDRDYKATIGVDFEIERFEIAGAPFSLQIWDTAGQEKFKCIASTYYRGAEVIITVFDLADIQTLQHTRQWLKEALRENSPESTFVFLVGTKKDLVGLLAAFRGAEESALSAFANISIDMWQSDTEREQTEADAVYIANEMQAEYWSVSAKTGENVKDFFFRVASLAFEKSVLMELEKNHQHIVQIGAGNLIKIEDNSSAASNGHHQASLSCC